MGNGQAAGPAGSTCLRNVQSEWSYRLLGVKWRPYRETTKGSHPVPQPLILEQSFYARSLFILKHFWTSNHVRQIPERARSCARMRVWLSSARMFILSINAASRVDVRSETNWRTSRLIEKGSAQTAERKRARRPASRQPFNYHSKS